MQTKTKARRDTRRGVWIIGMALLLMVAAIAGVLLQAQGTAQAASLTYARGYSVQGSWLCYGWSNGAYHCTQHWHRDASGKLVSDNPAWVPNVGGTVLVVRNAASSGATVTAGQPCHDAVSFPANIGSWTVPNGCYAAIYFPNPANYPARPSYGWCNWWPEVLHPMDAGYSALHGPVDGSPHPGDVIHYNGGVDGASSAGHFGQVVALGPNGWMLTTEMNFYWRGGGWQKVDYRYVRQGPGVWYTRA